MTPELGRLQRTHWALVATTALAAAVAGAISPASVVLGGGIIGGLTWLYARAFRSVVVERSAGFAIVVLFVKVAVFLGLGWLAFAARAEYRPDPMGFALGVSCLPAAAVWEALRVGKG